MAETTLKALKNEVNVIGRVKEVNLEEGTTRDGKENIKGNVIVLVEENVNGEVRSHDIRVRVYSNKFKRDGNINGLFSGYETVMNEYKSIADTGNKHEADLVHVQGSLELNEYISQDGTKRSSNQVSAKFFNRITTEDVKKRKGPKAVATIAAAIVCPVVNTGVFLIGCRLFFFDTIKQWAGGTDVFVYMITGLVGFNFLFELGANIILSPTVVKLTKLGRKEK